jgi:DNA-binding transcriptional LysR family regulator
MRITLKQIVVFDAVARLGVVGHAANEIALSQSATSMALQDLERNLGIPLFHRHRKKLTLNENGRRLQPRARSLLMQAQDIERVSNADELQGKLGVGATTTIGQYVIPKICADFIGDNPGVQINLQVGESVDLISRVDNMALDLGFIEVPCNRPSLRTTHFGNDVLKIVASPEHRLSRKRKVVLNDLKGERWFLQQPSSGSRTALTMAIGDRIGFVNIGIETNSLEAIKKAVKSGKGIACMSLLVIEEDLYAGTLAALSVPELDLKRNFNIISRTDVYRGNLQSAFMNYAMKCLPALDHRT